MNSKGKWRGTKKRTNTWKITEQRNELLKARPTERSPERTANWPTERPTNKNDRPNQRPTARPTYRATDWPTDRLNKRTTEGIVYWRNKQTKFPLTEPRSEIKNELQIQCTDKRTQRRTNKWTKASKIRKWKKKQTNQGVGTLYSWHK